AAEARSALWLNWEHPCPSGHAPSGARSRHYEGEGMIKIGINGFGRIGRMAFRAALGRDDVQVVAVNDLLDIHHLAYLLRYDSVHDKLGRAATGQTPLLVIDGSTVRATAVRDPAESAR